ncbi:predicted protein [Histoplasma mississippiense (nom. inval.)]|uniref:predicted protein n=1 Tax=Ajellomyces capsulatus (strain NAm1 / WU24) TaxID=2059318 RepID=UPI000157C50E|nr:predicted protein [Histoplasma mississippiense (nom. inval.)]EDN08733.1 predicted protein [Histoplasma mississippiense (nom. inval.)]
MYNLIDDKFAELERHINRFDDKAVQAYRWYRINVTGRGTYTGTTAFERRADALYASAKMMVQANPESLYRTIRSGAGHDSVFTSTKVPTSMVFVPCKDGVSLHPEEFSSAEDCVTGATVILQAVVRYDQMRFKE